MGFEVIIEGAEQAGPDESARQRWAWLGGLIGAETLAIGAVILAVATAFALVGGTWAFPVFLMNAGEPINGIPFWLIQPRLVAGGAAVLLGLAGLYRARPDSASWVRPVAGSAAVVGLIVVASTVLSLQTFPDSTPSGPDGG